MAAEMTEPLKFPAERTSLSNTTIQAYARCILLSGAVSRPWAWTLFKTDSGPQPVPSALVEECAPISPFLETAMSSAGQVAS